MNYLSVENLSKHYGDRLLFENLKFGLAKGDKVALIANNGAGKSTILKILAGNDFPDKGKVVLRNGIRVGYLDQDPSFGEEMTVSELINSANSRALSAMREYHEALEAQASACNEKTHKAFEEASDRMEALQAWDNERKMKTILSKFNIRDLEKKAGTLSGGEKKRFALALLLIDNPELLLLDEPTNHLDVEMVEWLENHLVQSPLTLLMVTHDRYFLDRVCNNIIELENGKLYSHTGNYSYFLEKRSAREQVFNVDLAKAQRLMKNELEWMRRMPKARTTKSKSRIDAFHRIKEKASSGKVKQELKLEVKMSRIGGKILEMKKVYKSYGDIKILSGFDYTFKKGERIGVIGKNGVGKTTFLNVITGVTSADSGKVNTGDTIIYGYYKQSGINLKEDKRVIDVVKDIADYIVMGDGTKLMASQLLQHFMFSPDMQFTYVSKLSGGEKRRLYLLTVLIRNPNFLILDEPTNDLDLLTLNKVEEFLMNFQGCVIIVSHDRYFMDKLVDTLFIFEGNGVIRNFVGTYTEYRNEQIDMELIKGKNTMLASHIESKNAMLASSAEPVKKKLTFGERIEYEKIEKEIKDLEEEKIVLETTVNSVNLPYDELISKTERIGRIIEVLDHKVLRWLELDEQANIKV